MIANPGPPAVRVRVSVSTATTVTLEIFDVAGALVAARDLGHLGPGVHEVHLDVAAELGARVASGVRFLRLRTPAGTGRPLKIVRVR